MTAGLRTEHLLRFAGPLLAGVICLGVLIAVLFMPISVRHSADFGAVSSLDADRGVAVSGARFTATYDNFNRVDLDLRAYTSNEAGDQIDLIVSIRGDVEGARPIRTIPISVDGWQIADRKPAFDDVFTTVWFDAIDDSAGRDYYVWVERGPRSSDDVVTIWSVKAYSTVTTGTVFASFIEQVPWNLPEAVLWVIFSLIGLIFLGGFGAMLAVFIRVAVGSIWGTFPRRHSEVDAGQFADVV